MTLNTNYIYNIVRNLLIALLLFGGFDSFAQVNANFTADATSGCAPVLINFTNTSTNATSYQWDFGNGKTSSNIHAGSLYALPGIYIVTLTANGAGGPSIKTLTITVYSPPNADFSTNKTNLCGNETLKFTDLSVPLSSDIKSWFWSFGDGSTSTNQNPQKLYNQDGKYTVYLQVKDVNGCQASTTKSNYININQPKANFVADSFVCTLPAEIKFNNLSQGLNLTYSWDFGDGSSSTAQLPTHTYNAFDTIPVKLTVQSGGSSCVSSITKYIRIAHYYADFNYTATCSNNSKKFNLNFTNTSIPLGSSEWDFGDGDTSTAKVISHQYATQGKYTIILKSIYNSTCSDTIAKTFESPNASFTYSAPPCKAPFDVTFTNTSKGSNTTSSWNFANKSFASTRNAVNTFINPSNYQMVILSETNTWGCKDIDTQYVQFPFPQANVIPDTPFTGCAPLSVGFKSSNSSNSPIVSYKWSFGDPASGVNNTSTLAQPSHTFNNTGTYDIQLIIENSQGCIDTATYKKLVRTGVKPTLVDFDMTNDSTCYNTSQSFTDKSTYSSPQIKANYWCWDWYGDNNNILINQNKKPVSCPDSGSANPSSDYTSVQNQSKLFNKYTTYTLSPTNDTLYVNNAVPVSGQKYIHLIVGNNGCFAETKKPFYIHGTMASPSFVYPSGQEELGSCKSPLDLGIYNGSSLFTTTKYFNVVNRQTHDTLAKIKASDTNFIHFSKSGIYDINIAVSNSSNFCENSLTRSIIIDSIIEEYYIPKKGCTNTPVRIINISKSKFGSTYKRSFDFGNGETLNGPEVDTVNYIYADTGTFIITSYTYSSVDVSADKSKPTYSFCSISHQDTIRIDGVKAKFSVPKNMYCENEIVQFSDSSYTTAPLTLRKWKFGDNQTSSQTNPQHKYYKTGSYDVTLVLANNLGCKDSLTKTNLITLTKPNAAFTQSKTLACYGDTIKFTNTATASGVNYKWDFGQGDTSVQTHPKLIYNTVGVFDVSLISTNTFGCKDTAFKAALIDVENYPTVNFSVNDSVGDCSPFLATFSDSSKTNVTTWEWNFTEGSVSFNKNPLNNYTHPGKYSVKLTAGTKNGCKSSKTKVDYIVVHGPHGSYTVQGDSGCVPFNTTFLQNFEETNYYTWTYGDGNVESYNYLTNPNSTVHTFNTKGLFTPMVQLLDTNNCSSTLSLSNIYAEKVIADFAMSDTLLCSLGNVQFTNTGTQQFAVDYAWDFGDQNYSIQKGPLHAYAAQDTFYVKLTTTSVIKGCTDTKIKPVAVFKSPQLKLDTITKTFCIPYKAEFKVKNNDPQVKINKLIWTNGAEQQDSTFASFNINTLGDKNIHLLIDYANNLCHIDSLIIIKALLAPVANFTFAPEHPSINTTVDFTENCDNTTKWFWKISDNTTSAQPNPAHDFFKNGEYQVTLYASNDGNCVDSAKTTIRISPDDFVKVVSGFSPNGDGVNDYVKILNAGKVTLKEFTIYNRWGQLVFKTSDIQQYWDGTFNGTLQNEGTFVYYITATNNETGKEITQKGTITLIK